MRSSRSVGRWPATPEGGFDLLVRPKEDAEWEKAVTWSAEDSLTSAPVSFTKDGDALYLIDSRQANTGRLVRMALADKKTEVIAQDPQYDVSDVMIHPDTYQVQAVAFTRARTEWTVLDESIKDDFQAIGKLDHGDFAVSDRDNADATWLVSFTKDDGPVSFYAYEPKTHKGTFLFVHKPDLTKYELARMEPISFKARDGLTIHGYLTFPGMEGAQGPAGGALGARRAVGSRRLGLRSRGPVVRQSRLRVPAGELPRLDRLRQELRQRRRPRVGRQDARRPDRRGQLGRQAGVRRPEEGRHLRRLLRRLRRPRRRDLHAGRFLLRRRYRRPEQPDHPDPVDSAVLDADLERCSTGAWAIRTRTKSF